LVTFAAPIHVPAVDGTSHSRCDERSAGDMEMANSRRDGMSAALAIVQSPRLRIAHVTVAGALHTVSYFPFGDRIAHVNAG